MTGFAAHPDQLLETVDRFLAASVVVRSAFALTELEPSALPELGRSRLLP